MLTAIPLYTVLSFVAMLLAIAACPPWVPHWWESNRNRLLASRLPSPLRSPAGGVPPPAEAPGEGLDA